MAALVALRSRYAQAQAKLSGSPFGSLMKPSMVASAATTVKLKVKTWLELMVTRVSGGGLLT